MFGRADMKMNLHRVAFRVEFVGVQCFLQFFRFSSFRKNLDFFFGAAAEPNFLRLKDCAPAAATAAAAAGAMV